MIIPDWSLDQTRQIEGDKIAWDKSFQNSSESGDTDDVTLKGNEELLVSNRVCPIRLTQTK